MGIDPAAAAKAVSSVTEVAGRYSVHDVNGRSARLMLAKNPAGWQEAMTMVDPRVDQVVIGVNGQVPDGQDLSWLWDVDFSGVNQPGRRVIACGERGADLAVRLEYEGVHCDLVAPPMDALALRGPARAEREKAAQVPGFDAVVAALPQGWDTQLGQGGVGLSVGQRQRLALTRALVNPSALVLLDEPSAHLDAISENQIVQAVLQLRAAGSTVVVIAHRQALINIADNVIEVCAQALAAQEA